MDGDNELKREEQQKLQDALRGLEKENVFVPGSIDDAMREAARKHFAKTDADREEGVISAPIDVVFHTKGLDAKVHPRVRRWHRWLPLAASIAIAATILYFSRPDRVAAGDVNRDGAVDVLDAMLLAQRVQSGQAERPWDFNGDGNVDQSDADEIMTRAVDLERSGG